ncbi:MAG: translation initiation factor IF-2 [Methermicoccaceae archaeon]
MNESHEQLRTPIVCVLGHVDHGKTTFLDRIRGTSVVSKEAGAITQHIGATEVPREAIERMCSPLTTQSFRLPGLLFIDTPGHHSFVSLRRRGGTLADLALLVVDITEGFKPQSIESLEILRQSKTPFVIALNKIDKIGGWRAHENTPFVSSFREQSERVQRELEEMTYSIVGVLYEHGFSADRYDRIRDFTKNVSLVPMSAKTGEGIADVLMVLMGLAQRFLEQSLRISVSGAGEGTVLEVKEERGFGITADVILYDGVLSVGDTVVLGGVDEPVLTRVRALLKPRPLRETRAERTFEHVKDVCAAAGVRLVAPDLERVLAGSPMRVVVGGDVEEAKRRVMCEMEQVELCTEESGLTVRADTLGSLEALVGELKRMDIPVRSASVGDISRRDVIEASVVCDPLHAVVLGFNVNVLPDAQQEAEKSEVKVITSSVIYRLVEEYEQWAALQRETLERKRSETIVKPAKLRILEGCVFRQSKPAVVGIRVLGGTLGRDVPLMRIDGARAGHIRGIQSRGENIHEATTGDEVAVSIEGITVGRQVKEGDVLYVDVPEKHARLLEQEIAHLLRRDELDVLEEFFDIKRKSDPFWGK